jgi:hypothetical protein
VRGASQRFGSPAADLNKTTLRKIIFSTNWPQHTYAEGGQVEPVLGSFTPYIKPDHKWIRFMLL